MYLNNSFSSESNRTPRWITFFSLCVLSCFILFRSGPDTFDTFNSDAAAEPTVTVVVSPSPYLRLSVSPLVLLSFSPPFLRTMPSLFSLTAWQNHNNPTDRRHRQGRRRPDLDLDQGTNGGSGVSLPSANFGRTAQGTCLSGLGHQLQHETRPMYEVNAGHVFHFARAQSLNGRIVPGK